MRSSKEEEEKQAKQEGKRKRRKRGKKEKEDEKNEKIKKKALANLHQQKLVSTQRVAQQTIPLSSKVSLFIEETLIDLFKMFTFTVLPF